MKEGNRCNHQNILVDYEDPHELIPNVSIQEIHAASKEDRRPFIRLYNPRCADCGKALTRRAVEKRLHQMNIYDARFHISDKKFP